ncbi:MAG: phosphoribosylformylglycinamidine synthase [Cyclobacteriaceae bacterium]
MIHFFEKSSSEVYAVHTSEDLSQDDKNKLTWLFSGAKLLPKDNISESFIGPRKEMITPWSTNAVEITQNAGISGIIRIESFVKNTGQPFDEMLQQKYQALDQDLFTLNIEPAPIQYIDDLEAYNEQEGLALTKEEIDFLKGVSEKINRNLTDSEVFGFSQVNSEHCRHKIFNGIFIIDGKEQELSLFQWIKKTSKAHHNFIVSAYKDNVAFIKGPEMEQFAPRTQDKPDYFTISDFESVISLKAETHNFPTTVEPFNGAATGSGGEIRDRMAGGTGSFPLAGTAVYMTSYSRLSKGKKYEERVPERKWLYQSPKDILIKASNGASDFGNKFGQPLICGSLFTFEHSENDETLGFDKVIMLAGGVGYGKLKDSLKKEVKPGQKIVMMGGDNYRIGMGGGAVSSVDTGDFKKSLELNAVQRSNPEMQKRVANAVRALAEAHVNPVVSIHDHGAGGHLNCFSELVEETGGKIYLDELPVGDPTLSDKEILGNESQERMGLVMQDQDLDYLKRVSQRERTPFYIVGEATNDQQLQFFKKNLDTKAFDLKMEHLFGSSPTTILEDQSKERSFKRFEYKADEIERYLEDILQLEGVACKDWLTNKVDRSVTGKVALQQTVGEIQVPLNNAAVMALDFKNDKGVATSIGHSAVPALIDSGAGSRLSVAEALTNLAFVPLTHGLKGVSLSANWMWPAKNEGENYRLYKAVKELSDFVIDLGINIPTGKDSLSMTQKYPDGKKVQSPGTVIISSVGEVTGLQKVVTPDLVPDKPASHLLYVDFSGSSFTLGGSSFAQVNSAIGDEAPDVKADTLKNAFNAIQELIQYDLILAGHDVSDGGLITTLLEMNFPNQKGGVKVNLSKFKEKDPVKVLFSERPAVVLQVESMDQVIETFRKFDVSCTPIGEIIESRELIIEGDELLLRLSIDDYRDLWFKTSHLLDRAQGEPVHADLRAANYKQQPLTYSFDPQYDGTFHAYGIDPNRKTNSGIKAAIIREQGVNGDREMAYALYLAGFDVKDVHMTDLISGREDLSDLDMIVFVGGFSNSDVLGSAKGWAGSFLFNEKAKSSLDAFYKREDTLSLGVCNGCQAMMELGLIYPEMENHPTMHHNGSGKFESIFVNVDIQPNDSVMFSSLSNTSLGIWVAHGEGKFVLPGSEDQYAIPMKYKYQEFPGNPNDSDFATAAVVSKDGRHVAMMPHLERSLFPWNWPHNRSIRGVEITPWIEPFVNARKWIEKRR